MMNEKKIFTLGTARELGPSTSTLIQSIAEKDLVEKVVVLPDLHHKNNMEFPSSTAVAVRGGIVPHLTSNSINCGMALVRTNLMAKDLREEEFDKFFTSIKESFPPGTWRPTITVSEVLQAITKGAQWALRRFGLDPQQFAYVAQAIRASDNAVDDAELEALHRMSHDLLEIGCYNFGEIGKSNHFIELQAVEEIVDRRVADLLRLECGQLVIMYHGGGGPYCGVVGNLFVPRKKGLQRSKYYNLTRRKIPFHLLTARSWKQFYRRINYFFIGQQFTAIPTEEDEGERLLIYDRFSMNYGYAYRVASLAMIQRALSRVIKESELSLVYDLPHNLITQEAINGMNVYVHRHNANPCYPANLLPHHPVFSVTGQPVLLPGTNVTSSFLCVADSGAEQSLFSVDHGAGHTVKQYIQSGKSTPVPGVTRRYRYDTAEVELCTHYDSRGVHAVLDRLVSSRIVCPVARLRPIACLT